MVRDKTGIIMASLNTTTLLGLLDPEDKGTVTLQNIENPMTRWHIPLDLSLQQQYYENLNSHITAATD
jgi:hypothetical protein